MRFISNLRKAKADRPKSVYIARSEREIAIRFWIKHAQAKAYKQEITCTKSGAGLPKKSEIAGLRPMIDENGLLRVGGRIDKANATYASRHPFIIPPKSRLSYLILAHTHKTTLHGGVQLMMRFVRSTYWIPALRAEARQFISRCIACTRQSAEMAKQIMADLPPVRIRPAMPFQNVGVDMAGPFHMEITDKINSNTRARTLPEITAQIS